MSRTAAVVFSTLMTTSLCFALPLQQKPDSPRVDIKKMKAAIEQLEKPVTLDLQQVPVGDVVKFLSDYSTLELRPDYEPLPNSVVTITVMSQPFGQALQDVLDQFEWTYSVKPDGAILLRPAPKPKK